MSGGLLKSRLLRRRSLSLTILLALVAVVWFYFWREPRGPQATTWDGKWQIRFLAAGSGAANYLPDSETWERLSNAIQSSAAGPYLRWFPKTRNIRQFGRSSDTGAQPVALLFECQLLTGPFPSGKAFGPELRVQFVDSNGYTHLPEGGGWGYASNSASRKTHFHWRSESFPRRDREITVQLIDSADANILEFRIANPGFMQTVAEWTPTELPARIVRDKFTLQLTGFDFDPESREFKPRLELEPRRDGWTAEMYPAHLQDATGNHGRGLSPWEPCWKLPVSVHCTADPEAPASERLRFEPVALPAKGKTVVVRDPRVSGTGAVFNSNNARDLAPAIRSIGNTTVTIGHPQSRPGTGITYTGPEDANSEALFEIDVTQMPRNVNVMALVQDQEGKELTAALPWCNPDEGRLQFALPFKAGDDVTAISISLMIGDMYEMEFFVAPPPELREQVSHRK